MHVRPLKTNPRAGPASPFAGRDPVGRAGRKLGDVKVVAEKLDCSPRHVYRLADAGPMPSPLRLASLVRWDLDEIDRWIADGCRPVRHVKGGA